METPTTCSGAERVDRDRGDQRPSRCRRRGRADRAEAVLAHVVAQAEDERAVDLASSVEPRRRCGAGRRGSYGATGLGRSDHGVTRHRRRSGGSAGSTRRGRQVEVDDQQVLGELRARASSVAVGVDDHRVAVEDQLVLAADHVDVGERRSRPRRRGARTSWQPDVVLVQLVRRAVDDDQQPGAGLAGSAANGPPSCQRSSQMVSATSTPPTRTTVQVGAGHEVAVLVEDAVVGQVVLGVAGGHLAAVQHARRRSAAPAAGRPRAAVGAGPAPSR